jgi:hypothetical protein
MDDYRRVVRDQERPDRVRGQRVQQGDRLVLETRRPVLVGKPALRRVVQGGRALRPKELRKHAKVRGRARNGPENGRQCEPVRNRPREVGRPGRGPEEAQRDARVQTPGDHEPVHVQEVSLEEHLIVRAPDAERRRAHDQLLPLYRLRE